MRVEFKNAVLAARFDGHVRDGHAVIHRERRRAGAVELHRPIGRAVKTDFADAMEDHVLGHHARLQLAFEPEMHRLGDLDEQLAGAHDEAGVRVADAGGELVERARHAGVRVGAEQDFAGPRVALLRQRRVADARVMRAVLPLQMALARVEMPVAVRVVNHVVEIRDVLLLHEIAQDVHVAVGLGIGGENVVVGDDDDPGFVPDLGVLAELAFEHADGARPANVVRHEHVRVHPDVVAGLHARLAGRPGEDFFRQSHRLTP